METDGAKNTSDIVYAVRRQLSWTHIRIKELPQKKLHHAIEIFKQRFENKKLEE